MITCFCLIMEMPLQLEIPLCSCLRLSLMFNYFLSYFFVKNDLIFYGDVQIQIVSTLFEKVR